MAHLPTTEKGKMNPGYNVLVKHASTQTNKEDFPLWDKKSNANTEMIDEDLLFLENERKESTHRTIEKDSSTQTTEDDFGLQQDAPLGTVLNPKAELSASQQINYKGNNSAATSKSSEDNRKRNVSSDQMTAHGKVVHKQSRLEMGEVIGTIREKSGLKPDLRMDTSSISNPIELNKKRLKDPKPWSNTEPHLHSPEMQAFDSLGNRISILEQTTGSNISIFQEENQSYKPSYGSEEKSPLSIDDIRAIPGPSRPRENILQKNLRKGSPQKRSPHKRPTMESTEETTMCVACKKESIPSHRKPHEEKLLYSCCQCKYTTESEEYLRKHIANHDTKPFYCEICDIRYSERGLHDDDQTCDVCQEKFKCKNQLEIHYLTHEEFHQKHCIMCKKELKTHHSECCRCGEVYRRLYNHVITHSPLNIYKCDICREGFKRKNYLYKHRAGKHPECEKCKERFLNSHFFAEHCSQKHRKA